MAREKNERIWILGGAVSALALAGALWTFVVSPEMDSVDSLRTQTSDAQTQNLVLQGDVAKLGQQYAHISETKQQLTQVQQQLPSSSGMSALANQLNAQAQAHHVAITQVTAAEPTTIASAAPASAASGAPASSTSAAPASGATTAAGGGVYVIQVAVSVSGSPANELAFVHAVQHDGPRAALVDSVQMQSGQGTGSSGKGSSMTLTFNVYVEPAAPTPTAPTPSATPGG